MKIDVEIKRAIEGLNNISGKIKDASPLMAEIAGFLADVTERAFDNETTPDGDGWADLAPRTIQARTKKGTWPGKMLQDSGQLAASVETESGALYAQIGTDKIYAATQQFGRGSIPGRAFIGLGDADIEDIEQMIAKYLTNF